MNSICAGNLKDLVGARLSHIELDKVGLILITYLNALIKEVYNYYRLRLA
jgi:hypothetical protein